MPFQPTLPWPDSTAWTTPKRRSKRSAGAPAPAPSARSARATGSAPSTGSPRRGGPDAERRAVPTTSSSSLYGPEEDWRLDESTRRTGRHGLQCARAVLAEIAGRGADAPGRGRRADAA